MRNSPMTSALPPLVAVAFLGLSNASQAQVATLGDTGVDTRVDRSFESAPKDCADVRWSQAALQAFPSIGSACQGVEQRNGKTYVKLEGTVEDVQDEGKRIRVDFEDGKELTFRPSPRTVLYMDGERTSFGDLSEGTALNFYIPEDRLQAELQPDPARVAFIIFPLDVATLPAREQSVAQSDREGRGSMTAMDNERRTELPSTAGALPLFGLGGAALILVAAGAALRRRLR